MARVALGDHTDNAGKLWVDIPKLVETRALLQANSGAGKSWGIRKLAESCEGKVQQIIYDIEGEFSSLREKGDYILAGKGGDLAAEPRTAEILARRALEHEFSLIIDLYELKYYERIRYVRLFSEALIDAPRELRHPVLVYVDEAHHFCPEKGQSEAMAAVVDLGTRGRKRGLCPILATQRISKLHKDVAAECLNKFIGRTGLDIDMKRAADELGFTSKEQMLGLRKLQPGEFFAFGPAVSDEVVKFKVGQVETTHPKSGQRLKHRVPPPTAWVKKMIPKLTDLPKQAEEDLRDREQLRARVRELERELRKKPEPAVDEKALERAASQARAESARDIKRLEQIIKSAQAYLSKAMAAVDVPLTPGAPGVSAHVHEAPSRQAQPRAVQAPRTRADTKVEIEGRTFGQCERKILGFLVMKDGEPMSKVQVGAMTGYRHSSGGFNNALSNLAKAGLIVRHGGSFAINPDSRGAIDQLVGSDTPHQLSDWIHKLGACERAIYQLVLGDPSRVFSKEEVAETAGYSAGSGGFNNALSRLNTLGLIERTGGKLRMNPELMNV